jgi:hypothetical protein
MNRTIIQLAIVLGTGVCVQAGYDAVQTYRAIDGLARVLAGTTITTITESPPIEPTIHAQALPAPVIPLAIPPAAPAKQQQRYILPPVEYDRYYEGDLTIKMVESVEELRDACGMKAPQMLACSMHTATACLIIMVPDYVMRKAGWTTGVLLRHEIGHCNGWAGNHPGQRAITLPTTHWVPVHERPIAKNVVPPTPR